MADPLARLPMWLQPFSITPNVDALAERRRLVTELAADGSIDPHTLVAAAHHLGADAALIVSAAARIDGTIILERNDKLAATVAAAALAVRLTAGGNDAALLALLVASARFLDLEPAVPELASLADAALAETSRRERQRLEPIDVVREVRKLLSASSSSAAEADATVQSLMNAVQQRDAALRAVAARVENLVEVMGNRFALLEEELDLLWWSRRGRRQAGDDPWDVLPPAQRAAVAATEMSEMLVCAPAPPSARSLLRTALGADADTDVALSAVAAAMQVDAAAPRLLLAPLTAWAAIVADVGESESGVAARLFAKVVPVAHDTARPLIDLAEQVLRERQIAALL